MSTTELVVDTLDIEFCLFEWLQIAQLQKFPKYADFDDETLHLLVTEGMKFAVEVIAPTNTEADREGCHVVDGKAKVPECLHDAYQQAYQLGWASVTASQEVGGQGAPEAIGLALSEATLGGNLALGMYFGLTQGAMELIESFGNEDLKNTYCEKMTSGPRIVERQVLCCQIPPDDARPRLRDRTGMGRRAHMMGFGKRIGVWLLARYLVDEPVELYLIQASLPLIGKARQ